MTNDWQEGFFLNISSSLLFLRKETVMKNSCSLFCAWVLAKLLEEIPKCAFYDYS